MTDQSGVGLPPPTMRCFLGLVVMLGALKVAASFSCPKVLNQDLIADPTDCRKYYHCLTDGRYFIKSCPHGLVFEPKNKVCMWDSSRSCAPQLGVDSDNVISPVAKLAATSTAKATQKKASSTTSEKPTTTTKATQSTTTTTKQTTSAVKTTTKTAPETKAPKVEVVVSDVKTTVKAAEAETTTADFSTGTDSENITGTSNTTDMRASENPTSGESNETSTEATKVESTESFKTVAKKTVPKHSVLKRSPFAQDNRIDGDGPKVTCTSAFAYVTDPENCHTFYHCNNWRPFQKRCPPGLFFDSQNLVCNWPHNVNCIEGYRAKSLYTYQNFRHVVRPQPNIQKIKIVESTTEKIPFLETIENDVRKVRNEEESDSTTAQVRPWYRFERKTTMAPETTSMDELTTEATSTTTEATTTTTTEPSTTSLPPSTSTDSYFYETRPSEVRSTWKDWNFNLFYTNSDRQDSDLDKLELFSNGKKVQPVKDDQSMSTDNSEVKSSTPASIPASSTTDAPSTTGDIKSEVNDGTTTDAETSTDAESTTTAKTTPEPTSTTAQGTDEETTTASADSTSSEPQTTESDNKVSSADSETKTSEKSEDETTSVPEASTRATSLDFGSDLERELKHPRKLQHQGLPPSNPFMTSDRIAANQQSMYARDYTNVEDVEIEKFMMKMLNDAMESKHMVARQASEEYPDNLVEGAIEKKTKESEMGESDALDKWAIADKEGKKIKGTLIEENVETDEVEASGEIENFSADTENHITNLILKDEAKPKTTEKPDNVTESTTKAAENKTDTVVTDEAKEDNKTAETTLAVNSTTTTTVATTTAAETTTTAEVNATTTKATETTKAAETTTASNATTTVKTDETTTTVAPSTENATVKAVPLLKDVSDLCTDKNNCSTKSENSTDETTKNETVTTKADEANTTTTVSTTTQSATNATTEATTTLKADDNTTTSTAAVVNVTEATEAPKTENKTEKAEVATTTVAEAEIETTTELPIAKDAAVKVANDFMASSDNEINKKDKSTLKFENRPLLENATKSDAVNTTETQEDLVPETTSTVNASVSTGSEVEETTSEETSEEDIKSEITSTISLGVDTTSQEAKVLNGESKGTTKKSFISLSDLIKWYLRHWRHYSRWRDSKEVKPTPQ